MWTSFSRFTVALALASSVLGAAIPTATDVAEPPHGKGPCDVQWKSICASEALATTSNAQAKLAPFRRSGELWKGAEHEEITPISSTLVRRSGELWKGVVHEEITTVSSASSRRSGELWEGVVHEEVSPSVPQPSLD